MRIPREGMQRLARTPTALLEGEDYERNARPREAYAASGARPTFSTEYPKIKTHTAVSDDGVI
jgi:hypothetical protein